MDALTELTIGYFQTGRDGKILRLLFKTTGVVAGMLYGSNKIGIDHLNSFVQQLNSFEMTANQDKVSSAFIDGTTTIPMLLSSCLSCYFHQVITETQGRGQRAFNYGFDVNMIQSLVRSLLNCRPLKQKDTYDLYRSMQKVQDSIKLQTGM